jgi:N-acetylneuraminate synthase
MKNTFILDKRRYSKNNIMVIAEACDNHFGSIKKAFKMIDLAKESGADVIKFQHHLPDEEMLKKVPKSKNFDISLYDFLKKNALKLEDHYKLKNYCKSKKITYLCTPFSLKAAYELNKINVCGFKIGSGEMSDHPTIKEILKYNKPIIVSTGMSTVKEIKETYNIIKKNNKSFALMNCLSEYPTYYKDLNLRFIIRMKEFFSKASIGHSDHTGDIFSSISAVTLGATIIEKHVTLDKKNNGPDKDVSIDFSELSKMIDQIRKLELAFGDKKFVHKNEWPIRKWAHRSIVTIRDVKKNEKVTLKNIWSKRPGTGIPSKNIPKILGKKFKKDLRKDQILTWKDLLI